MAIEYRKLCEKDLNIFIEMRINQLREEGAKEDIDLKPALQDYYMRHMKDGAFIQHVYKCRLQTNGNCKRTFT